MTTIYQTLLGETFQQLSPVIQKGHGTLGKINGKGILSVTYGKGTFISILNTLSGMPPEGKEMVLELNVERGEKKEIWTRVLKNKKFVTVQYRRKNILMERAGPVALGFELHIENGVLYYRQAFTKIFGIRLPAFMGLQSKVMATGITGGWNIYVETGHPWFGMLLRYEGHVILS